jgi:hypothetical protein
MVHQMPDIKAVMGREVRVLCPASGYPLETITWSKGELYRYTYKYNRTNEKYIIHRTHVHEYLSVQVCQRATVHFWIVFLVLLFSISYLDGIKNHAALSSTSL